MIFLHLKVNSNDNMKNHLQRPIHKLERYSILGLRDIPSMNRLSRVC